MWHTPNKCTNYKLWTIIHKMKKTMLLVVQLFLSSFVGVYINDILTEKNKQNTL